MTLQQVRPSLPLRQKPIRKSNVFPVGCSSRRRGTFFPGNYLKTAEENVNMPATVLKLAA